MQSKGKYFLAIGAGCLAYPICSHYAQRYVLYRAYKHDKKVVDEVIGYGGSETRLYGKILSGEDFNKIYSNDKFVKFTNYNEKHGDVTYTKGRVVDVNVLTPDPLCGYGMHFMKDDVDTITNHLSILTHIIKARHMREIKIPNDAYVCVGGDGLFKTNKMIVGDREYLHKRHPEIMDSGRCSWLYRLSSDIFV
jgi:hypothetical protein